MLDSGQSRLLQIGLLTLAALVLRCYMANMDPFLHTWDEQFHALVARNMTSDPFVPMLRKAQILPYDYRFWTFNTVWLHKQPLFMWQMALSMKLFGNSLFAMRLPSVLMSTVMVPMIYQLCRNMKAGHFTALTAAGLHCFSNFHLDLVSGHEGMDHNDVAFSFYVLASIWAYSCHVRKPGLKWVLAIGLFAGGAVLCKWLTGLVVYFGWAVAMLVGKRCFLRRSAGQMATSMAATAAVVIPWQIYILRRFPLEARHEYALNNRHLTEAVEGHSGGWDYYFQAFPRYFGDTIGWLVPVGILIILFSRSLERSVSIALMAILVFELLFFSFIPKTKIYSFIVPVLPLGYIAIAFSAAAVLRLFKGRAPLLAAASIAVFVLCCNLILQWGNLRARHFPDNDERSIRIANDSIYRNLHLYLKPGTEVVLNAPQWDDVKVMFYNGGLRAHSYCLNPADLDIYIQRGFRIAYFDDRPGYPVPDWLKNAPNAYPLQARLR